jgi:hypothetical protein
MKYKFFYIFISTIFLIGALKFVKAGNFQINLENSTTIDMVGYSY